MERDEAVARRQQGVALPRLHVPVHDEDVRPVGDGRPQLLELAWAALATIHGLEDEGRALIGRERGAKGVDEAQRVLPLPADEVEEVEEDEARGKTELVARHHRLGGCFERHRRDVNGDGHMRLDGVPDVLARRPDLVDEHIGAPVAEDVRLPEPDPDRVAAREEARAHVGDEGAELVGVQADDVRVVRRPGRGREPRLLRPTARRPGVGDRRVRDAGRLESAGHLPPDLAETELGVEVADEIDAGNRRAGGIDHTRSTLQSSSGRTTPRHWPLNWPRAESPSPGSSTSKETAS